MRLLLAVALVLEFFVAPAIATDFPAIGGAGDHAAVDQCPDGMYLVGLKGRAGAWVDRVQIVCARAAPLIYGTGWLSSAASGTRDARWFGPERGGTSGAPAETVCPMQSYVVAAEITLTHDKQVLRAFLACASIEGEPSSQVEFQGPAAAGGAINLDTNYCPAGEVGRGFTIRYGEAVNAMGLICGNVASAAPSSAVASAASSASLVPATSSNGAIAEKWQSLGGAGGFLGVPTSEETGTPDGVGRYSHFAKGSIYWTPQTGAHEVHGAIAEKWASMGREKSPLGYPTSDETGTPDGVGRYNRFQNGSIYWSPETGAHEVHGGIAVKWALWGWEKGPLGFPTSDEFQDSDYRRSNFQHGFIRWSQDSGAVITTVPQ